MVHAPYGVTSNVIPAQSKQRKPHFFLDHGLRYHGFCFAVWLYGPVLFFNSRGTSRTLMDSFDLMDVNIEDDVYTGVLEYSFCTHRVHSRITFQV